MIPIRYIEEWKENAPWPSYAQIEQDMIIARALEWSYWIFKSF
jgi:hypothetical protein